MAQLARVPDENQLRSLFDAKVRRGIFNPVLRFLPIDIAEDRLQDAIAQTWTMFRRYAAEKGKLLPDAILVYSCRQRAVDPSRFFVPNTGAQRRRDALDFRNYISGRVEILHFDGAIDPDEDECGEGDRALIGLAVEMSGNPTRKLLSAINLGSWLDSLAERDRDLLAARAAGFTLGEIAADAGKSLAQVHARCQKLGKALARRAAVDLAPTRRRARSGADDASAEVPS